MPQAGSVHPYFRSEPHDDCIGHLHAEEQAWVAFRLVGWGLLGLAQVVVMASVFWPEQFPGWRLRFLVPAIILAGVAVVAYGFEQFVATSYLRSQLAAEEMRRE